MNENQSSSANGVMIGIIIVLVIAIIAWIAYSQGFFTAKQQTPAPADNGGVQLNVTLPAGSNGTGTSAN